MQLSQQKILFNKSNSGINLHLTRDRFMSVCEILFFILNSFNCTFLLFCSQVCGHHFLLLWLFEFEFVVVCGVLGVCGVLNLEVCCWKLWSFLKHGKMKLLRVFLKWIAQGKNGVLPDTWQRSSPENNSSHKC